MGHAAVATTAAAVALLVYLVLRRRMPGKAGEKGRETRKSFVRLPAQPPATWWDVVETLAETVRFTYSETLGKWPIGDLAFGINYLMRQQGNLQVASVYAGNNCTELKGREVMVELIHLLRLLNLCMWFSKNPFPVFLEYAGYSQEDVLLQEPKAGVTASSWLNDLRDRIKQKRFLNVIYRSVTTLGSHLPWISRSRARVAGTETLLQPVSNSSELGATLSSQSSKDAPEHVVGTVTSPKMIELGYHPTFGSNSSSLMIEQVSTEPALDGAEFVSSGSYDGKPAGIEKLEQVDQSSGATLVEEMTEGELWSELVKELHRNDEDDEAQEEEAAAVKEIVEEESMVLKTAAENKLPSSPEMHHFYPPGRIMHMVMLQPLDSNSGKDAISDKDVGIYQTPRDLYGKIRLSRTMINDHYMPMYKRMMELLIDKLGKDDDGCETISI
ncbi:putative lipoprotein lipase [Cocos nucifera]|uniref:Putative lipoprotein lipase n=1 Tax=Cocos nucifera TaxID=13894 RepID=A0A8K0MTS5_COCNU|nr:putative lipoprotein lipase [Cocos nucifera]